MLALVVLVAFVGVTHGRTLPLQTQPVSNNYPLANSSWPICHHDSRNSDSSPNPGPRPQTVTSDFLKIDFHPLQSIDTISLVFGEGDEVVWGSSMASVFQLLSDGAGTYRFANHRLRKPDFHFHGAYAFVTSNGTYFAAAKTSIQAFSNEQPHNFSTPIVEVTELTVSVGANETLVGLNMLPDGMLVFVTSAARVGVASQDFSFVSPMLQLPGRDRVALPEHMVSNSFAVGPDNGIYVVTSLSMTKTVWNPSSRTLSLAWSTDYSDGEDPWYRGRLGPGSGSSPTLVGNADAPDLVVVTDGRPHMRILYFNTSDGNLAGEASADFGNATANSTSEQSVVVWGYEAVVVQNWVEDKYQEACEAVARIPGVSSFMVTSCPFLLGGYAVGVQKFRFDVNTNTVSSVWVNQEVSCASNIPVVSTSTGVLWCLGRLDNTPGYQLHAMDWGTGTTISSLHVGGIDLNPLYSGSEIVAGDALLAGTIGGILNAKSA